MNSENASIIPFVSDTANTTAAPEIRKKMNGCTVVLRFAATKNEQVSTVIRDILIKSYTEKLFSQNA